MPQLVGRVGIVKLVKLLYSVATRNCESTNL
jgi:hypothetical protein